MYISGKQTKKNPKTNMSGCEESRGNLLLTEVASRLYHYGQVLFCGSEDSCVCLCVL